MKKRIGTVFLILLISLAFASCKKPPTAPDNNPVQDVFYNLLVRIKDIFTGAELGNGNVILNGESKTNGSTYSVKNGVVSTLDVTNVAGFIQGYIAGKNLTSGTKYNFRDKNGHHAITIAQDADIDLWLIPNDFDTLLLAKSVGNGSMVSGTQDSIGDGIIQNYNKQNIPAGMHEFDGTATAKTREIINTVRDELNNLANNPNLGQIIYLQTFSDVTSAVSNGFTAVVRTIGGGHSETMSGNIITKSGAYIHEASTLKGMFKAEAFQAVSGIRWDAGLDGTPYVSYFGPDYAFQNDAQRATWLANLLPPGFHLDPNSTPTSVYARIGETTNRDPNYIYIEEHNEPGLRDFMNPVGQRYREQPRVRKIPRNPTDRNSIRK